MPYESRYVPAPRDPSLPVLDELPEGASDYSDRARRGGVLNAGTIAGGAAGGSRGTRADTG